jgi:CheY-like chemotaxis protein
MVFDGQVMIVSDFQPNAHWLAEQFERNGVACRLFRRIEEALREIHHSDLLIVDANIGATAMNTVVAAVPSSCVIVWLSSVAQAAPENVFVLHKPVTISALQQLLSHLPVREKTTAAAKKSTPVLAVENNAPEAKLFSNRNTILIVEDNQINRIALLHMLHSLGFEADAVESGQAALDQLHQQTYQVVLMDIQMAGMDGLETTRRILQQLGSAAPKIIAVSAHVFPDDIRLTRDAGMIDFVGKPIRRDELNRVLQQHISGAIN